MMREKNIGKNMSGDTCTRIENEQYISFYIRSVYDNCVGAYKLFDPTTIILSFGVFCKNTDMLSTKL